MPFASPHRTFRASFVLGLLCLLGRSAGAGLGDLLPVTPPFRVAQDNQGVQKQPRVAADDRGGAVFVWSRFDVYRRRFDREGQPLEGDVFCHPNLAYGEQDESWVAVDPWSGDFVVCWSDRHGNDGYDMGIGGRFFAADGSPRGDAFLLNTHTTFSQFDPRASFSRAGTVVVSWTDAGLDGSAGAFARRFLRDGTPLGPEFLLNEPSSFTQIQPAVACFPDGSFVAVWTDASGKWGEPREIVGRLFDAGGQPLGGEFPVLSNHAGMQRFPGVAAAGDGSFVVVWQDESANDGSGFGVFARLFDAGGQPLGPEFSVAQTTQGDQRNPQVASDWLGNFVCVWEDFSQGEGEIRARRFRRDATPLGPEFSVGDPAKPGGETWPTVALLQSGQRMVFSWFDDDSDAWGRVFEAQWFDAVPPIAAGVTSQVTLDLPGAEGQSYLLLVYLAASPPTPVPVAGPRAVPIALDPLLLYVLAHPQGALGSGYAGTVDAAGRAQATVSLPAAPQASGIALSFVAVTFAPDGSAALVSEPWRVELP